MLQPTTSVFLVLVALSTTNALNETKCDYNYECKINEICDMPSTSFEYVCLPLKRLNQRCESQRQCSEKVPNSVCQGSYYFVRFCGCRAMYNEVDGQCKDSSYCDKDSDCFTSGYGYTCQFNECRYRSAYSDPTYTIVGMAISMVILIAVLMCCVSSSRSAGRLSAHATVPRRPATLAPSSVLPRGGAAPYISTVSMLTSSDAARRQGAPPRHVAGWPVPISTNSSEPMNEDLPPPSYSTVVTTQGAYPKASYDNEAFQS
ncbi:hypothetical protein HDE_03761 [Halotydeus destructor]|nr:hypothetical protein HDE_03761 [Halotydeus destructor]